MLSIYSKYLRNKGGRWVKAFLYGLEKEPKRNQKFQVFHIISNYIFLISIVLRFTKAKFFGEKMSLHNKKQTKKQTNNNNTYEIDTLSTLGIFLSKFRTPLPATRHVKTNHLFILRRKFSHRNPIFFEKLRQKY